MAFKEECKKVDYGVQFIKDDKGLVCNKNYRWTTEKEELQLLDYSSDLNHHKISHEVEELKLYTIKIGFSEHSMKLNNIFKDNSNIIVQITGNLNKYITLTPYFEKNIEYGREYYMFGKLYWTIDKDRLQNDWFAAGCPLLWKLYN